MSSRENKSITLPSQIVNILQVLLLLFYIALGWGPFFILLSLTQHCNPIIYSVFIFLNFAWLFTALGAFYQVKFLRVNKEALKETLEAKLFPFELLHPGVIIFVFIGIAANGFAALSFLLNEHGCLNITAIKGENSFITWLGFYFWHLCEMVPGLDITKTCNWESGITYAGVMMPSLLLSFKIIMLWFIIERIYKWIKLSREAYDSVKKN